jgi:hypothetical protein
MVVELEATRYEDVGRVGIITLSKTDRARPGLAERTPNTDGTWQKLVLTMPFG